ncbi:dihydrodipicolinate synthase family protein [Naumannella cuiyingiana]|uniref:4-hydroxy-tetrahydrodipicolinate synthase n=1 Tax=Naumannella cuiyingiana TaxID=1347891 RepID=A0A7Z0D963_9ACTN|nr:dihydrodipicolinate synthase family protein [Naumannella cuiyingiana]NYI71071.1 4-hydroxy-tetrahydrodipicolinate synthase [Naumannella cuiyingiana]
MTMTRLRPGANDPLEGLAAARAIRGVSPVLEVPFTESGDVDLAGFRRVVRYVLGTGVASVMFPGFAGEFYKLSETERACLMEVLVSEARAFPDTVVIAAVQDHATRLAAERAAWSVSVGAKAINLLPPHLLKPPAPMIEAHIRAVLAEVPTTPVVLQYAPNETGTALDVSRLAAIARDHPNLTLVKVESSPPGPFITELSRLDPPIPAVEGYAGVQLPDAIRRGAVGTQPGCSFTEIYQEIWRLYEAGRFDDADRLHARLLPFTSYWMLDTELIIAAEKLISVRRGLFRSDHCRAPRRDLDDHERDAVDRFLIEFAEFLPYLGPIEDEE